MDSKTLIFVAVAAAIAFVVLSRGKPSITPQEARAMVEGGALLLDVRTPAEYASGHIDGAVNIPVGELRQRLDELPDSSQPIVLYCASGQRSGRATRMLREAGHEQAHNLGGIGRWK
ncbi:MAG: rhodanese-like domain-containing protein [Myxococcales bacterium]|jgi:rhodanese-related sulfurtransferase